MEGYPEVWDAERKRIERAVPHRVCLDEEHTIGGPSRCCDSPRNTQTKDVHKAVSVRDHS
jgi:hypothetical protein